MTVISQIAQFVRLGPYSMINGVVIVKSGEKFGFDSRLYSHKFTLLLTMLISVMKKTIIMLC